MRYRLTRSSGFTLIELLVVIAILSIVAALLFPVFAEVRGKARQAVCLSNLKQIGNALQMYLQDYDDHMPNCCHYGRAAAWSNTALTEICSQAGITYRTPTNTFFDPEQSPPRYIQELLHPYTKSVQIWFCPSVSKDARYYGGPTYGYNGTTYEWNWWADPTTTPNPYSNRQPIEVSGLPSARIPRPAEAPAVIELPYYQGLSEPCVSQLDKPAHAKGLNVLYADGHAKFAPFANRPTPGAFGRAGFGNHPCVENWRAEHNWEGYFDEGTGS
jgi:prepilin-type N-terminal cleavage/methylation domain-containing protein/prepilin-type processing-associated H-X9-DG protein